MTIVRIPARFVVRRATAADWTSGNDVLLLAEIGWEKDTGKFKFGDGVTAWNSLAYFNAADVPIADAGGYYTGTDVEAALQEIGAALSGVSSDAVSFAVAQVAHGFSVGHVVQLTGASWAVADRDVGTTVADAFVSAVADADNFTVTRIGKVTATTGQWDARTGDAGGLTAGEYYWLSSTAGGLTKTQPTSGVAQCLGVALSTTVLLADIGEAVEVSTLDPELAAFAGITTAAADQLPYFTSATAMTTTAITAAARSILDDASVTAILATLGVVPGTYTPTLYNTTNVAASTAFACQYVRILDMVIVSGRFDVDPTAASVATVMGMDLPIASNFSSNINLGGSAFCNNSAGLGASILADSTNDRATFQWVHNADTANRAWSFIFMYRII